MLHLLVDSTVKKEPIGNLTKTAIVFAIRLIYSNFAE